MARTGKGRQADVAGQTRDTAAMVLDYMATQFSCGFESVPVDDVLDNGDKLGAAVETVHIDILNGHGTLLDPAVRDAFEAMNCVMANNMDSFRADDSTDCHGTVGDIVHRHAPTPPDAASALRP